MRIAVLGLGPVMSFGKLQQKIRDVRKVEAIVGIIFLRGCMNEILVGIGGVGGGGREGV